MFREIHKRLCILENRFKKLKGGGSSLLDRITTKLSTLYIDIKGNLRFLSNMPQTGFVTLFRTDVNNDPDSQDDTAGTMATLDNLGNVITLSCTWDRASRTTNSFVLKQDSSGNILWKKLVYESNDSRDDKEGNAVSTDSQNNIIVAAGASLIKLDPNGDVLWIHNYNAYQSVPSKNYPGLSNIADVEVDEEDIIYVLFSSDHDRSYTQSAGVILAKYSPEGELLKESFVGEDMTGGKAQGYTLYLSKDNTMYISYYTQHIPTNLIKLDKNFNVLWSKSHQNIGSSTIADISILDNGNLAFCTDYRHVGVIDSNTGNVLWINDRIQVNNTFIIKGDSDWSLAIETIGNEIYFVSTYRVLGKYTLGINTFDGITGKASDKGIWLNITAKGETVINPDNRILEASQWWYYCFSTMVIKNGKLALSYYLRGGHDTAVTALFDLNFESNFSKEGVEVISFKEGDANGPMGVEDNLWSQQDIEDNINAYMSEHNSLQVKELDILSHLVDTTNTLEVRDVNIFFSTYPLKGSSVVDFSDLSILAKSFKGDFTEIIPKKLIPDSNQAKYKSKRYLVGVEDGKPSLININSFSGRQLNNWKPMYNGHNIKYVKHNNGKFYGALVTVVSGGVAVVKVFEGDTMEAFTDILNYSELKLIISIPNINVGHITGIFSLNGNLVVLGHSYGSVVNILNVDILNSNYTAFQPFMGLITSHDLNDSSKMIYFKGRYFLLSEGRVCSSTSLTSGYSIVAGITRPGYIFDLIHDNISFTHRLLLANRNSIDPIMISTDGVTWAENNYFTGMGSYSDVIGLHKNGTSFGVSLTCSDKILYYYANTWTIFSYQTSYRVSSQVGEDAIPLDLSFVAVRTFPLNKGIGMLLMDRNNGKQEFAILTDTILNTQNNELFRSEIPSNTGKFPMYVSTVQNVGGYVVVDGSFHYLEYGSNYRMSNNFISGPF